MKKLFNLLPVINSAAILAIALLLYFNSQKDGYVYVETYKVYDGFVMKKQLQKELDAQVSRESQKIDSLRVELKMAGLKYHGSKDETLKKAIALKQEELALREREARMQYEKAAEKYDAQIWAQINQYIIDYGKMHDERIIFGASGNGSVMYGEDAKNVTDDVIAYVNKRHQDL
jgi:outer membrane protein